ncbi:MAG: phosphoribulokinase [Actinomycetota bacterium]|nr:phosphoribulokinase [Acidimicrobiia bacterium]MDQ3468867.1 phosphoribulokinase [Actinomycetota bacterium]
MSPKAVALERLADRGQRRPVMLAIAGDSASGKTTLTRGIVDALDDGTVGAFCVDDYHRYDRDERRSLPYTPLDPACNYLPIMEQHLRLVAMGEPILKPVYNHDHGTLDRPVLFDPPGKVIVEGLLPLHSKMSRACFDLSVYLDPPETIRRAWKVQRDTRERGYTDEQVHADLAKREPDSEAFIRPQRRWADIVVRFGPIEERHERAGDPLSATILLRPQAPHPDLSAVLGAEFRSAIHLKMLRDDDGKPVDALHVHGYASRDAARCIEEAIWSELGVDAVLPAALGAVRDGTRSEPLAVVQLIILYHLLMAGRTADALDPDGPTG